ncbi:MAG: DNA mismatch repair endonuclease MutL, partial [Desulfatiglandales bacterium]|nr:DNA mismatch repair endonuclease MutL [Desulfatiglandales bacterium]
MEIPIQKAANLIRILPEKVASQIAAGEIIERPASVVRELVDNSIDAGPDRITIKIEKGGKGLIRVSDNGVGMSRDDLLLCLERHATSKINSVSDLYSIRTLGFRGEAVPSISSVSRMVITSRPVDQLTGYRLSVDGGQLKSVDETGSPAGTMVEIRDLFFNMPARRKFLRAVRTETDHIIDTLSRIALPFNGIHFRLDDSGKTILNLPVSEKELNRLSALMGRNVAVSMIDSYQEAGGFFIRVYLAPPDLSRARGDRLFIYVNKRSVRDRLLTRAIMEGYGQRLMKGRYPLAVVFIEADASLVDVNVHPTKQEVRFQDSRSAYQAIVSTIEKCLAKRLSTYLDTGFEPGPLKSKEREEVQIKGMVLAEAGREYSGREDTERVYTEEGPQEAYLVKGSPQVIGQLKDTYILCQTMEGLLMIDQHAAHERIVYETLKRSYQSSQIQSQSFLIPHELEFSLKDGRVMEKKLDQLAPLGLDLEHFGGSTFLLRSVPTILINV